jgi:hypothetical protein
MGAENHHVYQPSANCKTCPYCGSTWLEWGRSDDRQKLSERLYRKAANFAWGEFFGDAEEVDELVAHAAELEERAERAERELELARESEADASMLLSDETKRRIKAEEECDELREQVEAWEFCARAPTVNADWWADEGGYHIWVYGPNGEPLYALHAESIMELVAKVRAREEEE